MAKSESGTQQLTQKSSKFESFLKKNLDESTYNRLRGYEGCIVCSNTINRQLKKLVLSDEAIYFTENPEPKTIQLAVRLEDVFEIELNDAPANFLSGKTQQNTTHIEIKYWQRARNKANTFKTSQDNLDTNSNGSGSEQTQRSGSYHLDSLREKNDDNNEISLLDPMSKSMPESGLKSLLKTRKPSDSLRFNASKKVTIDESLGKNKTSANNTGQENNLLVPGETKCSSNESIDQHGSSKADFRSKSDGSLDLSGKGLNRDFLSGLVKLTMHLYMIVPDSKMLVLIRSAVNNHLIKSTLMINDNYAGRVSQSPRRTKQSVENGHNFSEKLDILFSGLTKELMDPNNSMEHTFELAHELKSATDKYFHLKKLFWKKCLEKSGDLFSLFIRILQQYLPKSPSNLSTEAGRSNRADEFELIILVIQTLGVMFRETEIFPTRLIVLKSQSGGLIVDLMTVLACVPELPSKHKPPTERASKLLLQTEADNWKCLGDIELHKLFVEFTGASTAVMFELLVIAQQSHWVRNDTSFFNVCWFMQKLEQMETSYNFLEQLIGQAMRHIQPSKDIELSPAQAILVFQQFYVLHAVIKYSPLLANFIRNNYSEEFKYYIQAPVLSQKLPPRYPISTRTMLLIQEVMGQVLERDISLSFTEK